MKGPEVYLQSLFWPVLFFITGIVTSSYAMFRHLGVLLSVIIGAVIMGIILWILVRTNSAKPISYLFSLLLFYCTAYAITTYHKHQYNQFSHELSVNPNPTGTITEINHFHKMDRIRVRIPAKNWWNPTHYFIVNLLEKDSSLYKGQTVMINRSLKPITSSSNPFTFQAREYWKLQNTSHEVFLYHASDIQILQNRSPSYIDKVRQNAAQRIDDLYVKSSHAGILKALILGQKEAVAKVDKESFKKAGLMHILAVSGLHVGIIASLLFLLLLPVKLLLPGSWAHFIIVVIALWLYAALTGMNTPVVRAVILMTFYLTARRIDRQVNKWNIYFWAILLVLVIHPTALFTISFQLSFGAVASILLFYRTLNERVTPILGQNYFSGLVAVSLAAQLGIFPFLLFHFQEVSLVSTLSSFLVIPLLFPLILMTSISIIIPDSIQGIATGISRFCGSIVDLITNISDTLAGWNIASQVWVWSTTTLVCLLFALLLTGLYLESKRHTILPWLLQGAIFCLIVAGVSEVINIYQKRSTCVMAVYENNIQPITDLYFQGVAYTNYDYPPPASIVRNRKNYYVQKSVLINNGYKWEKLLNAIREKYNRSSHRKRITIQVKDYIESKSYMVDITIPPDKFGSDTNRYYLPISVIYNENNQ